MRPSDLDVVVSAAYAEGIVSTREADRWRRSGIPPAGVSVIADGAEYILERRPGHDQAALLAASEADIDTRTEAVGATAPPSS